MTSLDLAFDDEFETSPSIPHKKNNNIEEYQSSQQQSQHQQSPQPQQSHQAQYQQVSQSSHIPQPQTRENFNNYSPYQEQSSVPQIQLRPQQSYQYSFWDRMVISRREVLKLFILSLVIILGISIEKIGYHYLSNYINSVDLSSLQEFLVRLSFPILVFIILWIIKSL